MKNLSYLFHSQKFRIALGYMLVASAWILGSDALLQAIITDAATLTEIQSFKGLGFVLVTSVALYLMLAAQNGDETNFQSLPKHRGSFVHLAIMLATIALLVITDSYIYNQMRNDVKTTAQARLRDVGELKKKAILRWLFERTADARVFSSSPLIVGLLENSPAKPSRDKLHRYLRKLKDEYQYKEIVIYDRNGDVAMMEGTTSAAEHAPQVLEVIKSGQSRLIDFHYDPDGKTALGFLWPIRENDMTVGVFFGEISPETVLYPLLMEWPSNSSSAETTLSEREGENMVFLNNLRHRNDPPLSFRVPMSHRDVAVVRAATGERGILVDSVDYRDVPVVSYASDIPGTPWILISKLDEAEAYAGLNRITFIGFFITGIALLLVWLLMRNWLIRPAQAALLQTNRELLQATTDLKTSEAKFRAIIDLSPVPYAINDKEGHIDYLNTAFSNTYGYGLTDIPTLTDWWPKAYPDKEYREKVASTWKNRMDIAMQKNAPFEPMEVQITCKDGSRRAVMASAATLGKAFHGLHLVVLYDISDRKRMERDLVELNEKQLQQLGMELHDNLGQQLTATSILAETVGHALKRRPLANENRINQIYAISRQLQEMTALVRGLAHGLYPTHLEQDNLLQMLADLADQTTQFSGITCRLEQTTVDTRFTPEISFNLYRIAQECVNNAVKHSHATEITITAKAETNYLLISIIDNGIGIKEDITSQKGGGLGIMHHRASLIGATLQVTQQQGLCIAVRIPL